MKYETTRSAHTSTLDLEGFGGSQQEFNTAINFLTFFGKLNTIWLFNLLMRNILLFAICIPFWALRFNLMLYHPC